MKNKQNFEQTWWNKHLVNPEMMETYKGWLQDYNNVSKKQVRNYVESKGYRSIVDFGCGPATEFFGYKSDGYEIDYLGIDSCTEISKLNKSRGVPFLLEDISDTSLEDESFEVVFGRHILQHQPSFHYVLDEMIRVAKKEAIHVFTPSPGNIDIIHYDESDNLYQNTYSKKSIEDYIPNNLSFEWQSVPNSMENGGEIILFIRK